MLKQASNRAVSGMLVDILVDKKYVNEDETTNRTRYNNFLVINYSFNLLTSPILYTFSLFIPFASTVAKKEGISARNIWPYAELRKQPSSKTNTIFFSLLNFASKLYKTVIIWSNRNFTLFPSNFFMATEWKEPLPLILHREQSLYPSLSLQRPHRPQTHHSSGSRVSGICLLEHFKGSFK